MFVHMFYIMLQHHKNIQFWRLALLTSLPTSVLAKSFGHTVIPSFFRNNEPHIANVPYVIMEWSDKLNKAKSIPKDEKIIVYKYVHY